MMQDMSGNLRIEKTGREHAAVADVRQSQIVPYERSLNADSEWALNEGSRFFEGRSGVQEALRRITRRLEELGIPYAVAGGMALFHHGYRRFTDDIDILVTKSDREEIQQQLTGRGYLPTFTRRKNLRDTELGVKINFLTTGNDPGDGKPKPVAFPNPADVSIEKDGLRILKLESLIELKLASGLSAAHRLRDLADVQELIRLLDLPAEVADSLHPSVRDKFLELRSAIEESGAGPDEEVFE